MAAPESGTHFSVGDPEVPDRWEKEIFRQWVRKTVFFNPSSKFVGSEKTNLCQRKKTPFNEQGTRATETLVKSLRGTATHGNQTMRDREEGIDTSTFQWEIQKVRHAVKVDGEIVDQRVTWNVIETSSMLLGEWFAVVKEAAAAMHMTGFTINAGRPNTEWWLRGNDLGHTLGNTPVASDGYVDGGGDHYLRAGGNTTDEAVGLSKTSYLDIGDFMDAKSLAMTLAQPIRPVQLYGQECWVVFVHPYTVRQWKDEGARWWALATNAIQGGMINGNPIVKGTVGFYENLCFIEWPYLPPGIHSTDSTAVDDTRRAVLCGQQALMYGVAKRYPDENSFRIVNEKWDYGDKVGVEAHTLAGIAKPQFELNDTTQDFATITLIGYAKDMVTPS